MAVAGLMLFSGTGKLTGTAPPEVVDLMARHGFGDRMTLIGAGEVAAALLLLVPLTAPFGLLMTSGFWGGVIATHMGRGESYAFGTALLVLTWVGGYLRGLVGRDGGPDRPGSAPR